MGIIYVGLGDSKTDLLTALNGSKAGDELILDPGDY
jgi:hypothetical protein